MVQITFFIRGTAKHTQWNTSDQSALGAPWVAKDPNLLLSDSQIFDTIKIMKIPTPEKFAVITLKFEQGDSTVE